MRQPKIRKADSSSASFFLGRRTHLLYAVLLGILGLAVYGQTLRYEYINWDDLAYIKDNVYIQRFSPSNIIHIFSSFYIGEWFPVQLFSYMIDHALWGLNPIGYHLENVLIHALNAFLVFLLARRLLAARGRDCSQWVGMMAGLIFLLHPVQVESVVWMSQRKAVLCLFFMLLSFLMYLSWRENRIPSLFPASLLLFALSLLSKINSLMLPVLLLVWEWALGGPYRIPPPRDTSWYKKACLLFKPILPFGVLSLTVTGIFLYGQIHDKVIRTFYGGTPYTNFLATCAGLVFKYPNRLLFPVNLTAYYPRVEEYRSLIDFPYIIAVPVWMTLLTGLFRSFRTRRETFFLLLWFVIIMIPTSGIVPAPFGGADRHLYFPGIGLIILFSMGVYALRRTYPLPAKASFIIIVALLSALTMVRSRVWSSSRALWEDVASKTPQLPYAQFKLAQVSLDDRRLEDALLHAESAVSLDPSNSLYMFTLGQVYNGSKNYPQALACFRKADEMDPGNSVLHMNMAMTYEGLGEWTDAISEYRRSIELDPGKAFDSMRNLAVLDIRLQRYKEARDQLENALKIIPDSSEVHRFLGALYLKAFGMTDRGVYHLRMSLEIDPAQPGADALRAVISKTLSRSGTP